MGDYQAVYDAAFQQFDISHVKAILLQDFSIAAQEMSRPSVLFKPTIGADGDMWCALLGENLVEGVAGFGKTPHEAMLAFDQEFYKAQTPAAIRLASKDAIMSGFDSAIDAIKRA